MSFCLKATIPAGNNNANAIIPQALVMANAITPIANKVIPTALLFLTMNVIMIPAIYRMKAMAKPPRNGLTDAMLALYLY
jgi:hypothetical protein